MCPISFTVRGPLCQLCKLSYENICQPSLAQSYKYVMGPPLGQSLCSESVACEGGKIQSLHSTCSLASKEELTTWWAKLISLCRWGDNSLCIKPLNPGITVSPPWLLIQNQKRIRLSFGMARIETIVFPIRLSPNLQGECLAMFLTNAQQKQ